MARSYLKIGAAFLALSAGGYPSVSTAAAAELYPATPVLDTSLDTAEFVALKSLESVTEKKLWAPTNRVVELSYRNHDDSAAGPVASAVEAEPGTSNGNYQWKVAATYAGGPALDTLYTTLEDALNAAVAGVAVGERALVKLDAAVTGYTLRDPASKSAPIAPTVPAGKGLILQAPTDGTADAGPGVTFTRMLTTDTASGSSDVFSNVNVASTGTFIMMNVGMGRSEIHETANAPRITSGAISFVYACQSWLNLDAGSGGTIGLVNCRGLGAIENGLNSARSYAFQIGLLPRNLFIIDSDFSDAGNEGSSEHLAYLHDINFISVGNTYGDGSGHSLKRDGGVTITIDDTFIRGLSLGAVGAESTFAQPLSMVDISSKRDDCIFVRPYFNHTPGNWRHGITIQTRDNQQAYTTTPNKLGGPVAVRDGTLSSEFLKAISLVYQPAGTTNASVMTNTVIASDLAAGGTALVIDPSRYSRPMDDGLTDGTALSDTGANAYEVSVQLRDDVSGELEQHRTTATFDGASTLTLADAVPAGKTATDDDVCTYWLASATPDHVELEAWLHFRYDETGATRSGYAFANCTSGNDLDLIATDWYGRHWVHRPIQVVGAGANKAANLLSETGDLQTYHVGANNANGRGAAVLSPVKDPDVASPQDATLGIADNQAGEHGLMSKIPAPAAPLGLWGTDTVNLFYAWISEAMLVDEGGSFAQTVCLLSSLSTRRQTNDYRVRTPVSTIAGGVASRFPDGTTNAGDGLTRVKRTLAADVALSDSTIEVSSDPTDVVAGQAVLFVCDKRGIGGGRSSPTCYVDDDYAGGTTIPMVDVNGDPVSMTFTATTGAHVQFVPAAGDIPTPLLGNPDGYFASPAS